MYFEKITEALLKGIHLRRVCEARETNQETFCSGPGKKDDNLGLLIGNGGVDECKRYLIGNSDRT